MTVSSNTHLTKINFILKLPQVLIDISYTQVKFCLKLKKTQYLVHAFLCRESKPNFKKWHLIKIENNPNEINNLKLRFTRMSRPTHGTMVCQLY